MFDGKRVSSVKSWRFFEDAINEQRGLEELTAAGVRPGEL